ncbi:T-cell activation Rho GTPase-activating protein-like [Columba livia]|uniref:T-cell activation Rho GTPase-activating protein-like n=1 Tax=Columba livia TaxID=8932 RepID=UPI0031BA30BE
MGLPWPFALRRSPATSQAPGQVVSGCSRALFGQPLAALCGEDGTLPQPIQELLAVLRQEGPSTEGIFRRATSGTALRELREALDRGLDVDMGSQPADLLAVILKDFLRNIPSKLLVEDLYEEWMAALERCSMEEKMEEMKVVAKKLPAANLLLLKELMSLLQHIGHNADTSRMTFNNLAICVGPNLLSPPKEELLPLDALLEVTQKVNVLVEFLMENFSVIFGEETAGLSCPSSKESPVPMERSTDLHLEEQSGPAGRADENNQVPLSSTAMTSQSSTESLEKLEKLRSPSEERRFAGSPKDKEKERKRKRIEVWGEEDDSQMEKKRKKRGNVSGDGARKRHRKLQRFRKPRSRFPVSS